MKANPYKPLFRMPDYRYFEASRSGERLSGDVTAIWLVFRDKLQDGLVPAIQNLALEVDVGREEPEWIAHKTEEILDLSRHLYLSYLLTIGLDIPNFPFFEFVKSLVKMGRDFRSLAESAGEAGYRFWRLVEYLQERLYSEYTSISFIAGRNSETSRLEKRTMNQGVR
jgi:hypothetical protein